MLTASTQQPTARPEPAIQVAPARFVTIGLAAAITGLSASAIRTKIARGVWVEGRQYVRAPDGHVMVDLRVVPLVACPLCGAESGYRPDEGSTCRWWSLRCASCRQEVTECAAGKNLYFTNETRWPHCDEAWNAAGAYADAWRVKAEMLRAAIERACASYPDDAAAPTCVAILREALRHNVLLSGAVRRPLE